MTRTAASQDLTFPPALDAGLILVAILGVSFSGPLMAATAAPALAIAFWRNLLGAVATGGFAVSRGHFAVSRGHGLRRLPGRSLAVSGVAGVALAAHFATWVPSLTMTSVASATALVSSQTVWTAVIAALLGRRLPRLAWAGIVVATVGAGLVTGADVSVSGRALVGDGLALAGGLAAAIYVTIGSSARSRLSNAVYTTVCYAACAVVLLLACVTGGVALAGYPSSAWWKLIAVTGCAQLLGHTLINLVLRSTSPTVVGLALLFEVPGAAVVALVWLHQHPPLSAVPGLVLLFLGLVFVARSGNRPVEATE